MGLGQSLGYTYRLPQNINQGLQQPEIAQQGPSVAAPPSGMQYVEDITREYYTKWGEVQSFATNMWENFGIDVTRPDFRKPEAMEAHEIYNKAIADLRYQGDELKQGQMFLEEYAKGRITAQGPNIGLEKTPEGIVTDITNVGITSQELEAGRDERARKVQAGANKRADIAFGRALALQDKKMFANKNKLMPFRKIETELSDTLLGRGDWYASRQMTAEGSPYLKKDFWSGTRYGKDANNKFRTIDGVLWDQETGEQFFVFQDGTREAINREDINDILRLHIRGRGVGAVNLLEQYLLVSEDSGYDTFEIEDEVAYESELSAARTYSEESRAEVDQQIIDSRKLLNDIARVGGEYTFVFSDGFQVKVEKSLNWVFGKGKFIILNPGDIYSKKELENRDSNLKLTEDEMIAELSRLVYFGFDKPGTIKEGEEPTKDEPLVPTEEEAERLKFIQENMLDK